MTIYGKDLRCRIELPAWFGFVFMIQQSLRQLPDRGTGGAIRCVAGQTCQEPHHLGVPYSMDMYGYSR